jgi:hypothetical protein
MEKPFTVEQMKAALLAVRDRITPAQLLMLKGHYGCRIASMAKIATSEDTGKTSRRGISNTAGSVAALPIS